MSIIDQLDTLRRNVPGCTLVAFADLRTRLILSVSTDRPRPQEQLDEMCFQAVSCFKDCDALTRATLLAEQGNSECTESIILTPVETRVYIRSPDGEGEALFCICQPTAQTNDLAQIARQSLQQFSGTL